MVDQLYHNPTWKNPNWKMVNHSTIFQSFNYRNYELYHNQFYHNTGDLLYHLSRSRAVSAMRDAGPPSEREERHGLDTVYRSLRLC